MRAQGNRNEMCVLLSMCGHTLTLPQLRDTRVKHNDVLLTGM